MTLIDIESNLPFGPGKEQGNERLLLLEDHHVLMMGKDNTASYLSGVFNLSCTIIGAGIMSLPFAMKVLGVIPGVLLVLISGFLTKCSIGILLRFSDHGRAYTYGQLMRDAFGRIGEVFFQISVVVNITGIMIIYLIIVGKRPVVPLVHFYIIFLFYTLSDGFYDWICQLMCFLGQLLVGCTTLVFWKSGLECTGSQAVSSCKFP